MLSVRTLGVLPAALLCAAACSDPKPPAPQAALMTHLTSCADSVFPVYFGTLNDLAPENSKMTIDGENGDAISCTVRPEGEGFYVNAKLTSGTGAMLKLSGALVPSGGAQVSSCSFTFDGQPGWAQPALVGKVTVYARPHGQTGSLYEDPDCYAAARAGDDGKPEADSGWANLRFCCKALTPPDGVDACGAEGRLLIESCAKE